MFVPTILPGQQRHNYWIFLGRPLPRLAGTVGVLGSAISSYNIDAGFGASRFREVDN